MAQAPAASKAAAMIVLNIWEIEWFIFVRVPHCAQRRGNADSTPAISGRQFAASRKICFRRIETNARHEIESAFRQSRAAEKASLAGKHSSNPVRMGEEVKSKSAKLFAIAGLA